MTVYLLLAGVLLAGLYLGLRLAYARRWDRGLGCALSFSADFAYEGETVTLAEVVENRKLLPLPAAEVSFHLDRRLRFADNRNSSVSDRTYRRDVFALGPRQRITRRLELNCVGRGYFSLEQAELMAKDLLMTREFRTRLGQSAVFYVLPSPAQPPRVELPFARVMGTLVSRKRFLDDPFEFAGLREYSRSDPMKTINWKATARAGRLLTNLRESTMAQRVTLLLDGETAATPQGELLAEEVIRIAAGLCRRFLAAGVEVTLKSNAPDARSGGEWSVPTAVGAGSFLPVLKSLACLAPGPGLPPVCQAVEESSQEPVLVLITADPREELTAQFAALVGEGWGLQLQVAPKTDRPVRAFANIQQLWLA